LDPKLETPGTWSLADLRADLQGRNVANLNAHFLHYGGVSGLGYLRMRADEDWSGQFLSSAQIADPSTSNLSGKLVFTLGCHAGLNVPDDQAHNGFGDIDPALVTYIMHRKGLDIHSIDNLLNKTSGLKGISGISNDMRVLEACCRRGNKRAKLAIDIFVYRIKKYIGAYTAIMGGCDALVFTAGIGENQAKVRDRICKGAFLHLKKKPKVLVISTDEELMIARQAHRLIRGNRSA
ncbi:MAG: hypothetical protein NT066_01820, partial [Candidatus Omnitrophica bacterium]|nr:hypothetical protein [Candidatus Omnitrophota bacterium]